MKQPVHAIPPGALERFAAGKAAPAERRGVIGHLLDGCPECQRWLRRQVWGLAGEWCEPPAGAYDHAFAAAGAAARAEATRRCLELEQLLAEVDGFATEERELKVRNLRRFASTALAAALIERSHRARWRDPETMLADARLAVAAADGAAAVAGAGEARALNDCQARAWGQLANALRLHGSLLESEDAFAVAFHHLDEGTGDCRLKARLYRQLASLRRARRQFYESAELLRRAIAIHRRQGDHAGEAAALINLGISYIYAGDPAAAEPPLARCLAELDPRQHIDLVRAAGLNLVTCHLDLGEPARAHALWAETEPLFAACDDQLALLRRAWQRGLIDRELGHLEAAEHRLWQVREGFLRHDLVMESAIVSLHLAAVYLRQHRVADVVRTIGEIIPIFQSLGWTQELLASLTQLAGVAHDVRAALELLEQISHAVEGGADTLTGVVVPHD